MALNIFEVTKFLPCLLKNTKNDLLLPLLFFTFDIYVLNDSENLLVFHSQLACIKDDARLGQWPWEYSTVYCIRVKVYCYCVICCSFELFLCLIWKHNGLGLSFACSTQGAVYACSMCQAYVNNIDHQSTKSLEYPSHYYRYCEEAHC